MKPYQDHDPIKDKGKAVPHPPRPNNGWRGRTQPAPPAIALTATQDADAFRKKPPGSKISLLASVLAMIGLGSGGPAGIHPWRRRKKGFR